VSGLPGEGVTDVVGHVTLTPDPAFIKSLGTHHTLESAMADLVDNSIDAGATKVTIQLLTTESRLSGIVVADDGAGMDDTTIERAMTLGGQRPYAPGDLGHFGVGLKAAALGNADVLTVWSRRYGSTPVGRRIRKFDLQRDYSCEVLSHDAARDALDFSLGGSASGTVVALSEIKAGIHSDSSAESAVWLATEETRIRQHLGLVYHRILAQDRITIEIVQLDAAGQLGSPAPVAPIDPFRYPATGAHGYPHVLHADASGVAVAVTCHIWPAQYDNNAEYRLLQKSGEELQGFYVYRADRLLQIGGWNNVTNTSATRRLARVAIDIDALGDLVQLNPEKNGTQFHPNLAQVINRASSEIGESGVTFAMFLKAAEEAHVQSKKRRHHRAPVVEPAQGFSPVVRNAIGTELEYRLDEEPVNVKWRRLPLGTFFEIDRPEHTLWLNLAYRDLLSPGRKGMNDAPLMKTLIFLLTQEHFTGVLYGVAKKDEALLWQKLLGAAAEEEAARRRRTKETW